MRCRGGCSATRKRMGPTEPTFTDAPICGECYVARPPPGQGRAADRWWRPCARCRCSGRTTMPQRWRWGQKCARTRSSTPQLLRIRAALQALPLPRTEETAMHHVGSAVSWDLQGTLCTAPQLESSGERRVSPHCDAKSRVHSHARAPAPAPSARATSCRGIGLRHYSPDAAYLARGAASWYISAHRHAIERTLPLPACRGQGHVL